MLYVRIDDDGKIVEELTLQQIRMKHRNTVSIAVGADLEEIVIETKTSIAKRKLWQAQMAELEEDEAPPKEPDREFHTYIRAVDEPPTADETFTIVQTGVQRVDGTYRVGYVVEKKPAGVIAKEKSETQARTQARKLHKAFSDPQTQEAILNQLFNLSEATNTTLPEILEDLKESLK